MQNYVGKILVDSAIETASKKNRYLAMPGNPRYESDELKPYFGYDQWAVWLAVVEMAWLYFLEQIESISEISSSGVFERDFVLDLFSKMTTREQDKLEKIAGHDINALIAMMSKHLPYKVSHWLHFALTSYDTIDTARALILKTAFENLFIPLLKEVDVLLRQRIKESAEIIQIGRTHLQDALPITVGCWLACIHSRYIENARSLHNSINRLTGKLSGAVGTGASFKETGIEDAYWKKFPNNKHAPKVVEIYTMGTEIITLERCFLFNLLGLDYPALSTQIVPPERMIRVLTEMTLLSGALAQLGEDARILQSSAIAEIKSVSSTSSTMAHKTSNPVLAENIAGMHTMVLGEYQKALLNLVSDLQRDLRNSAPARDYFAVPVYLFKQLKNTKRFLEKLEVNTENCRKNFERSGQLVMGELLYLWLTKAGMLNAKEFVNTEIVPQLKAGYNLESLINPLDCGVSVAELWEQIPLEAKNIFRNPELYIGHASEIALAEAENELVFD